MDSGGGLGPPSRRLLWVARGLFAACLVSGAMLALQPAGDDVSTTMEAPMETFRADGIGPVLIGMPWADAVKLGVAQTGSHDGCVTGDYRGVIVYGTSVVTGLASIAAGVTTTDRGVGVGTPESEARGLYPGDGDQLVFKAGAYELVIGMRDGAVGYLWARRIGQSVVGC